ncbi:MAG: hypothetical protein JW939_06400 [Candidatus Thermoplasmatota archaeon]|nr:hypothetical protein [Candidatus Thermoplasmatota archaeon]
MKLVLDTSAFLSGRMTALPSGFIGVYITTLVRSEVTRGAPARLLENLLASGLTVRDPLSSVKAEEAAAATGDIGNLSSADISVIALAMELEDASVVTDDFRVQNVLSSVGIAFEPAGEIGEKKIQTVWKWTYRCRGCGRYFKEPQKMDECPVCGSNVRPYRKRP